MPVLYLLTGRLPTLIKDAGSSISTAANVTAMFQVGGAIAVGYVMDKTRPAVVIGAAYRRGGLCILAVSAAGVLSPGLVVLVFATGFCMSGAQTGLNAYAPGRYTTLARATGVSWMLGIGRFSPAFSACFRFPRFAPRSPLWRANLAAECSR